MTLKATLNGSVYEDINLGRNIKTHVNDISTKFKTLSETGTLWMTNSPTNTDYIRVFLEDGVLKVKVKAGEVSIVYFHNNKYICVCVKPTINQDTNGCCR